jgi:His/Glu/Gln/Arg/opine family amino acid ABC transporter permease subunit
MKLQWSIIWDYRAELLHGVWLTIQLAICGIIGSTLIGAILGSVKTLPSFFFQKLTDLYVEVMRNLPMVVKLFFLHFILGIDAFPSGILAIIIHQSAYVADVTAAGLRSIPLGQAEAARAHGHSNIEVFRYILLPQALRYVIPPLTTQYVQVVKNSAVVMLISVQELTFMMQKMGHETFRGFEAVTAATIIYLFLALLVVGVMSTLEHLLKTPK